MFDIGMGEMAVVAVVALVVIGPKDLPVVLRQAGRWVRKARAMAADFQSGVEEIMREAELREMRDQIAKANPSALQRQIQSAIDMDFFADFDKNSAGSDGAVVQSVPAPPEDEQHAPHADPAASVPPADLPVNPPDATPVELHPHPPQP